MPTEIPYESGLSNPSIYDQSGDLAESLFPCVALTRYDPGLSGLTRYRSSRLAGLI